MTSDDAAGDHRYGMLVLHDARNDVYDRHRVSSPDADIVRAIVRHQGPTVSFTLQFAAPTDAGAGHQIGGDIRTDTGREWHIDMIFSSGHLDSWLYTPAGGFTERCSPRLRQERTAARLTVSVLRRCLGDPQWVRVKIDHDRQGHRPDGVSQYDYWDNPHNSRSSASFTPPIDHAPAE